MDKSEVADGPPQIKFAELTMKCLWKLTKSLQDTLKSGAVDVTGLLFDIHRFLVAAPPSVWKQRAAQKSPLADMPLRTVKTMLHELSNGLGASILDCMAAIPIEEPKKSPAYSYLVHMLVSTGAIKKNDVVDAAGHERPATAVSSLVNFDACDAPIAPDGNLGSSESIASVGVAVPNALSEEEVCLALDGIFNKISSNDETKQVYFTTMILIVN